MSISSASTTASTGEQRRVHDECLFVGVLFRDNAAAVRFHLFRTMAADTGVQYDSDALDECLSMLTVMNRLMYRLSRKSRDVR